MESQQRRQISWRIICCFQANAKNIVLTLAATYSLLIPSDMPTVYNASVSERRPIEIDRYRYLYVDFPKYYRLLSILNGYYRFLSAVTVIRRSKT